LLYNAFPSFENMDRDRLEHLITVDPEIVSGTPVFHGTRVPIQNLFDYLEETSLEDFLRGFPTVSRAQAEAVLEEARKRLLTSLAA